ncbi:MAG TPA: efflux transporter outer membrane subunit [Terriglobia bacterium]|nr:efflux transporter outer membrane subunit [Terriglobia bacterium]
MNWNAYRSLLSLRRTLFGEAYSIPLTPFRNEGTETMLLAKLAFLRSSEQIETQQEDRLPSPHRGRGAGGEGEWQTVKGRRRSCKAWGLSLCLALLSVGCAVGPNYKRPDYPVPPTHRSDTALPATAPTAAVPTLADMKWFDLFRDEKLQELIRIALKDNYDIRIAAQRVLAAQAFVTVEKSALYPSVDAVASADRQQGVNRALSSFFGGGRIFWELDIWGRIRRSTEAARAQYLSQEAVQLAVIQSLVTGVAGSYFQLLELDQELQVAKQSLVSRQGSLRLVQARQTGGLSNQLEVDQATSLVASAAATIADVERQREQAENFLNTLLGRNPGPVDRTKVLDDQKLVPEVPAGLPSALLDRRPDIRLAEQQLVAANARVGVAKSLFFPSISLTGSGGYQNFEISDNFFKSVGGVYGYGGSLVQPIFNAGALWANYKASKAQREAAILSYQKSVQEAFRDVADSLIGYQKAKEYRAQREIFVTTLRNQLRLANMRYEGGVSSYLEVLDTERQALDAELTYAQAYLGELDSVIRVYKALGGGWTQ